MIHNLVSFATVVHAKHNKQNDRPKKRFGGKLIFLIAQSAKGLFSVYRTLVLHPTDSA